MLILVFLVLTHLNIFGTDAQNNCTKITYLNNNNLLYETNISGIYNEYYDCQIEQNGTYLPWFGGVDYTRCYKKNDGSTWLIWNTGCGWNIGNIKCVDDPYAIEPCEWDRHVLYYAGLCNNISTYQSSEYGLNSNILFNSFGIIINNLTSEFGYCDNNTFIPRSQSTTTTSTTTPINTIDPTQRPTLSPTPSTRPCYTNITYQGTDLLYKNNISGIYNEYYNCEIYREFLPVFANVNYSICYKKENDLNWMIWNSGCGWIIVNIQCIDENNCDWDRYVLYYSGLCSNITKDGLNQNGLNANILYNNFGQAIHGLTSKYNNCGKKTTYAPSLIYRTKTPTQKPTIN